MHSTVKYVSPNLHVNISLLITRLIGTWPPFSQPQRILYFVYSGISFIFLLGVYLTVQAVNLVMIWGDIDRMVASAFLLMTNSVHAYKIFVILKHQKRIQALLDMIKCSTFSRDNVKYERLLTRYAWQGIKHHIAYQSFGTVAVFCWGFTPIADMIAGNERRLPMEAWYPYDTKKSPAFELTCTHQAIAVIIACFHNVAMDTFVTGLLNVACSQLQIIKYNIQALNDHDEEQLMIEFGRCIEHSNQVRKSIFGMVILFQLLVNCLIICLSAFHIAQMTTFVPAELFGMMMYLCCMTYQIFIYCYHGNELALQSQSLATAAFASNWWKFNKPFKQSLGIIITRSHKPIVFTAGPLMTLSLQTFVSILRMSYSFFTLLQGSTKQKLIDGDI